MNNNYNNYNNSFNNNFGNQVPNNQNINNQPYGTSQNTNMNQTIPQQNNYGQVNNVTQTQPVNNFTNQQIPTQPVSYQQPNFGIQYQQSVQNTQTVYQQGMPNVPNVPNNNIYQRVTPNIPQNNTYYQNIPPNNINNNNYGNYQYAGGTTTSNKSSNKSVVIVVVVLIAAIIVVGLFAKKKNGPSGGYGNAADYERTIMIYMVGANLESESGIGTADLNGLDYSSFEKENTKVVLIAGGSKYWFNNFISADETSIYELKSTGFVKVEQQNLRNMGEGQVLTDFLNYTYDNYKSKKYDLIFWNHGGGILGSEFDELHNSDQLSLKEMETALSNSRFSSNNKLEVVIFRTCLNGTIEVATSLKNYSQYLVASEEITRGSTFGGSVFVSLNSVKASDSGKEIGKKFVDGYVSYINNLESMAGARVYTTYSVIDLSKIDNVEKSLEDFFSSIDLNANYAQIARIRSNLYQYGEDETGYDSVDLYSLVDGLKNLNNTKANKLLGDIKSAVVYSYSPDSNSNGLSVYFPYKGSASIKQGILTSYYDFNSLAKYKNFITDFNSIQSSAKFSTSFANNVIDVSRKDTVSDFSLQLTEEQIQNFSRAGFLVFRDNKDGYYLPVYSSGKGAKLEENTLKANIKDRQLKVKSTKDDTENIVTLIEDSETDDYIKYKTYVVLQDYSSKDYKEWKTDAAEASIILDKKTNKVTLGSLLLRNKQEEKEGKTNLPYTVIVNPDDYKSIVFASSSYKILDDKGNYKNDWESDGVIKGVEMSFDELSFELNDFNDGYDYYAVFKIWDINNNSYYSKLVKMN